MVNFYTFKNHINVQISTYEHKIACTHMVYRGEFIIRVAGSDLYIYKSISAVKYIKSSKVGLNGG